MRSLSCLSFLSVLCLPPAALGEEPAPGAITVTGSATVRFYADAIRISYRIRSTEASADDARQATQKIVKLADEKLSALKIKNLKVSYAPASLSQQTERMGRAGFGGGPGGAPGGAVQNVRFFTSTQVGTLILNEPDKDKMADAIGKIEKALTDAGVGGSNAPSDDDMPTRALPSGLTLTMFRNDDAEFRDEALTKAVQNALRKAKAMAKGAGVQIKQTVSIAENEANVPEIGPLGPRTGRSASAPTAAASSMPGELEITVRVTVKFSY
jgi:uncharacterized protein YggE